MLRTEVDRTLGHEEDDIRRFPETYRVLLEGHGRTILPLHGRSVAEWLESGEVISVDRNVIDPEIVHARSRRSEVAISPVLFYDPVTENKTLQEQLGIVDYGRHGIEDLTPNVLTLKPTVADIVDMEFTYREIHRGRSFFHEFGISALRTFSLSVGGYFATVNFGPYGIFIGSAPTTLPIPHLGMVCGVLPAPVSVRK